MYSLNEHYLDDQVGVEDLRPSVARKLLGAKEAVAADGRPKGYDWEDQDDGSVEISIPVGIRRMLLGYDVDELNQVIFLNYLKGDGLREKLDWLAGLLGNDPGRK
jgi:hypothetical protein